MWIEYHSEILAVESKLTEYFTQSKPIFSDSYERLAPPGLSETCWWEVYEESKKGKPSYLDRAQLLKHYFGLRKHQARTKYSGQMTLLYLFWEPANWEQIATCQKHRREIQEFQRAVDGSAIQFRSLTYADLWCDWMNVPELADHIRELRARYLVPVDLSNQDR